MLKETGAYTTFTPHKIYLPLQQHIGAPCEAVVEPGQTVRVGELVGKADGTMSAHVHASVSGRVLAVEERPQINGSKAETVIIESDGLNTPYVPADGPPEKTGDLDADALRELVQDAGIVGMGGATFPTHVKMDTKDAEVDICIINAAECEPLLDADNALMMQQGETIIKGCLLTMRITGAGEGIIGIEENDPETIEHMETLCRAHTGLRVHKLKTTYPQGGEKQLIEHVTGREVPEGAIPSAVGVVVLNAATAAAVAQAVEGGKPLTHRVCTVTGDVAQPQNLRIPVGTLAGDLLNHCGGIVGVPSKVIAGGPMMGTTLDSLEIPLTKASNGLVSINTAHDHLFRDEPCIRCNRCVDACPMYLMPLFLDDAYRKQKWDKCERLHAQSCINCGCCTYICPAGRKLAQNIVKAKNKLSELEKEKEDDDE